MLQGLLSPSMELLTTAMDNNLAASHVWSFANQPDATYQAAAMDAILSQASLGLISEHQSLVNYGMLNHPPIIEGMDETQFLPQSSCAHPGLSSGSATTASSALGLDHKPPNTRNKHSSKPSTMMSLSYDLATGQAGMCDVSAAKRRSWQEALSSPSQTDNYNLSIENHNEREISLLAPSILYSVNDPKVSIASLAYPCTIVETTQESGYPSYIDNTSMCMSTHNIDPLINTRGNLMQESKISVAGMCADEDHDACMGHTVSKDNMMQMRGCANEWKEGIKTSQNPRKLSNEGHDQMKDGLSTTYEYVNLTHGSSFQGIKSDDNSAHLHLYKEEPYHDDGKEKDIAAIALSSRQPILLADHQSRKRPAAIMHLPSSSSSYSKRAHLQNKQLGGACSTTTTTTSSTTTRSSKSSSRNPQGPALNTNGKPRAMQGCANDPQSVAARNRRERINARLKVLQELVPNGSKVDLVTMLEKAINYVKFLQLQLRVLSNDDLWQENQDNGEQATTSLKEDYNTNLNVPCESMLACSDNIGRNHCNYV